MFIYVDESGCTGMKLGLGSSKYFTLAAVTFENQASAHFARLAIRELRTRLGRREFKFNNSRCRRPFLELASTLDFRAHSFTLNKPKLIPGSFSEPRRMYKKVTGWTLENLMESLKGQNAPRVATIVFDACGNREFYEYFQRFAEHLAATRLKNGARVKVIAQDSKSEDLLQLADMVCGAISRHWHRAPDSWELYKHIHPKVTTQRFWP